MSKVPRDMGKEVQAELQKALNAWTQEVTKGAEGYYKQGETQKIERQK